MDSSFLMPKISAIFDRGHPLRGRQMQLGWVKIGDFRQIINRLYLESGTRYRRMVSSEVEQQVVCALSNRDTADDLEWPLTAPNHPIFTARCYASAVLAMALCPSVCPSVRPSQVSVVLKRLNVGSHKQHRTIPQGI